MHSKNYLMRQITFVSEEFQVQDLCVRRMRDSEGEAYIYVEIGGEPRLRLHGEGYELKARELAELLMEAADNRCELLET